ncbi:MAG: sulfatase-like hydrolase/transferase [Fluviicola sp.]|nr:sulfatase-like hydrolase/transferase [Fluviicola sp.]
MFRVYLSLIFLLALVSCKHESNVRTYKTRRVIILVIDGPRYSETWGDSSHAFIPMRYGLLNEGVMVSNFRNNGVTFTNPGHTAICTGVYDAIANNGSELPHFPSLLQMYVERYGYPSYATLIASKDKLHILSNTSLPAYYNQFQCYKDCGVNGNGTGGYRADTITYLNVMAQLNSGVPRLMVVNFKEPDTYGHLADSLAYLNAIKRTDQYVADIYQLIQTHPDYKDQTTLIVTNDHGRHTKGWLDGYVSHGDNCEGCRHIELFAISPDFKKNTVINKNYEQIDIAPTVAELLGLRMKYGHGKVMWDLFLPQ